MHTISYKKRGSQLIKLNLTKLERENKSAIFLNLCRIIGSNEGQMIFELISTTLTPFPL